MEQITNLMELDDHQRVEITKQHGEAIVDARELKEIRAQIGNDYKALRESYEPDHLEC